MAPQPLKEEYLLSGYLEATNQPYAIAKIAGIEMCDSYRAQYGCNFISAMPTNLYGTNDNYHPENSHVLPALIRRIMLAKKNNTLFLENLTNDIIIPILLKAPNNIFVNKLPPNATIINKKPYYINKKIVIKD